MFESLRKPARIIIVFVCLATTVVACADDDNDETTGEAFSWDFLPDGFPEPRVPEDNPMSTEKIELGRHLFYDTRLSGNQTQSCGSCHLQELAFTDGLPVSIGATGEDHPRASMSLANAAYPTTLTWANPLMRTLEKQMLTPMFGDQPVELGLANTDQLIDRLRAEPMYDTMFADAFPDAADDPDLINLDRTTKAIAAFQRRIVSADSPFDRYQYGGDVDALNAQEKRGMQLFFSERLECFHCHGSFNFSDSVQHDGTVFEEIQFHNNGLYNIGGTGSYPAGNQGVFDVTGILEDSGRFRAPTLRNIAVTAPYMHDGSIATLSEVIDHYARGGRLIEEGPNAGDGKLSPFKSELINGFTITAEEKADLIGFLEALTDETLLTDPELSDPFQ